MHAMRANEDAYTYMHHADGHITHKAETSDLRIDTNSRNDILICRADN